MRTKKLSKKRQLKQSKGITLIALVITIIVLLILAGVSIATLTGDNGILIQANDAKKETAKAEARERIQLEMLASIGNDGKYDVEKAKQNLKDNLGLTEESGNLVDNGDGTLKVINNGYEFKVDEKGKVNDLKNGGGTVTFNPEELTIGEAINTDKYGWKVEDYTVATDDCPSEVWRLFYQDDKYTYLIKDELTATKYKPSEHYSSYSNGASVSTVGQKLSPKISSLFTESNENANIKFAAWMTDPEVWKDYKDKKGNAVFAIGSPTVELFVASYNAIGKANTFTLGLEAYGYIFTSSNRLSASDDKGIYNKDNSTDWLLASPYGYFSNCGFHMHGSDGFVASNRVDDNSSYACRPVVCILTSVFNSNYADSVVNE